jgi:glucose/arabinose dehydrogenase
MNGRARALLVPVTVALLLALACREEDNPGGGNGASQAPPGPEFSFGLGAEVVAGDGFAERVSAMEFAPDGRIFFTEQFKGTVRIIDANGTLQEDPFVQETVADYLNLDWGLTGLALDPDFETNHYVYVFFTQPVRTETVQGDSGESRESPVAKPVIVRYTEADGVATEPVTLVEDLPETDVNHPGFNANGELHFGPDGMLYASIGDYDVFETNPEVIQDPSSPIGKLLRLNPDGTAPDDNPFADDPDADPRVYALGFREPFPFLFADGTLYGTDNTTVSCEELNLIEAGGNYGWPEMGGFPFDDCGAAPGEQPIHHLARDGKSPEEFLSFVEASALASLTESTYTQLTDGLVVCESQRSAVEGTVTAGVLRRLVMTDASTVSASDAVVTECRGLVAVNDGIVYYATDNQLKRLVQSGGAGSLEATEAEGTGQQAPTLP